mmetsp:Transcript_30970/g.100898  ORF Transcript_30970/g.100898 Transcript_30970/m.100898 type:complete len:397 (+) Transcript_30970:408-1598(+)
MLETLGNCAGAASAQGCVGGSGTGWILRRRSQRPRSGSGERPRSGSGAEEDGPRRGRWIALPRWARKRLRGWSRRATVEGAPTSTKVGFFRSPEDASESSSAAEARGGFGLFGGSAGAAARTTAAGGASAGPGGVDDGDLIQPGRLLTALLETASWDQFGRHRTYANGNPRPLLRGWLHLLSAAAGTAVLLDGRAAAVLGPAGANLMAVNLMCYWASSIFHCVPWKSIFAYELALVTDFACISLCFTGHVAVWEGGFAAPAAALSLALSSYLIAVNFYRLLFASGDAQGNPTREGLGVIEYQRTTRLYVMLTQQLLLTVVEAVHLSESPELFLAIFLGSAVAPVYFKNFGAYDAAVPLDKQPLVVPGLWEPHDNFHLLVFGLHVAQTLAIRAASGF